VIYLEYIERDRHVPIEAFRYLGDQARSWVEPDVDRMILQLGRTLRLGPMPSYLAFWRIAGLHRLDAWETYFGSKDWYDNARSQAMHRTIHIQRAGLYDELIEGTEAGEGIHVVERFEAHGDLGDAAIEKGFTARAARHDAGMLNLLLRRVGIWGPDPAHLAVWTFPSYAAAEPLLREARVAEGIAVLGGGIYRRLGQEVL
jgi:hypothetical protein